MQITESSDDFHQKFVFRKATVTYSIGIEKALENRMREAENKEKKDSTPQAAGEKNSLTNHLHSTNPFITQKQHHAVIPLSNYKTKRLTRIN